MAHVNTVGCLSPGSGYRAMHIPATKTHSVLALYFEYKAVINLFCLLPQNFSFLSQGAGRSLTAPGRWGQEGDGCPVPLQPLMPVQTGDTAVSTTASALGGHTPAAAARVTTSTRTRGAARVSVPLLSCPFICFSLPPSSSCLSLSAHPSPSLTSDRLLQLWEPQLPARVCEHPQRALLPLPQRLHAATRRQVLQGYVLARRRGQFLYALLGPQGKGCGVGITLCPWLVFQPLTSAMGWITAASSSV